jgi:hypothetical protein
MAVSFTDGVKPHLTVKLLDYSDVPPLVLAEYRTMDTCATRAESVLIRGCRGIFG